MYSNTLRYNKGKFFLNSPVAISPAKWDQAPWGLKTQRKEEIHSQRKRSERKREQIWRLYGGLEATVCWVIGQVFTMSSPVTDRYGQNLQLACDTSHISNHIPVRQSNCQTRSLLWSPLKDCKPLHCAFKLPKNEWIEGSYRKRGYIEKGRKRGRER